MRNRRSPFLVTKLSRLYWPRATLTRPDPLRHPRSDHRRARADQVLYGLDLVRAGRLSGGVPALDHGAARARVDRVRAGVRRSRRQLLPGAGGAAAARVPDHGRGWAAHRLGRPDPDQGVRLPQRGRARIPDRPLRLVAVGDLAAMAPRRAVRVDRSDPGERHRLLHLSAAVLPVRSGPGAGHGPPRGSGRSGCPRRVGEPLVRRGPRGRGDPHRHTSPVRAGGPGPAAAGGGDLPPDPRAPDHGLRNRLRRLVRGRPRAHAGPATPHCRLPDWGGASPLSGAAPASVAGTSSRGTRATGASSWVGSSGG